MKESRWKETINLMGFKRAVPLSLVMSLYLSQPWIKVDNFLGQVPTRMQNWSNDTWSSNLLEMVIGITLLSQSLS